MDVCAVRLALRREESLNDTLASLGLSTRPGRIMGRKDVLRDGQVLLASSTAGEVWEWLRSVQ